MAQISLSDLGIRALDENGDTVAGALCYVYDAGTTTPVTTYSDDEMTTPNAFPVVANASGTFPPVFVPDGEYKVDVTDPDDASLSGYPRDNLTIGNLLTTRVETLEAEVDALELVDESLDARLDVLELLTPLDEDDFASDSDTQPPTQQSTKAYILSRESGAVSGALSGSAVDITGIPSGVAQIDVTFSGASLSGTDDILVQLLVGGTPVATGYTGTSTLASAGSLSHTGAVTSGALLRVQVAAADVWGGMTLVKDDGNDWVWSHANRTGATSSSFGGGGVSLAGEADGIRITRTGTNTFDAGDYAVRWRY